MKTKVGISSLTSDSNGARLLNQKAEREFANNRGERRSTRNKTLDNRCVVVDNGYAAADRTFIVTTEDETGSIAAWAAYMVENYGQVLYASKHGLYRCALKRWWVDNDTKLSLELLSISDELST
jgi:hypothetical protein